MIMLTTMTARIHTETKLPSKSNLFVFDWRLRHVIDWMKSFGKDHNNIISLLSLKADIDSFQ